LETRNHYRNRLCIVGSRQWDVLPFPLLEFLQAQPPGTVIMLRKPRDKEPSIFETLVSAACKQFWLPVAWFQPGGGGRSATFERDIGMVSTATAVLAFFVEETMSGGTEHVVEKAIDQRVPVVAYGVMDGQMVTIGSWNPDDIVVPELAL